MLTRHEKSFRSAAGGRTLETRYPGRCAGGCTLQHIAAGEKVWAVPGDGALRLYHFACAPYATIVAPGVCDDCRRGDGTHGAACKRTDPATLSPRELEIRARILANRARAENK